MISLTHFYSYWEDKAVECTSWKYGDAHLVVQNCWLPKYQKLSSFKKFAVKYNRPCYEILLSTNNNVFDLNKINLQTRPPTNSYKMRCQLFSIESSKYHKIGEPHHFFPVQSYTSHSLFYPNSLKPQRDSIYQHRWLKKQYISQKSISVNFCRLLN